MSKKFTPTVYHPPTSFKMIASWVGTACLWAMIVGLLGVNVFLRLNTKQEFSGEIEHLLAGQMQAAAHTTLAQAFWRDNNIRRAEEETLLAHESTTGKGTNILGSEVESENPNVIRERARDDAARELQYWTEIVIKHPDYRDAYLATGILYYKIGKTNEAIAQLSHALALDPNNKQALELLSTIGGITLK